MRALFWSFGALAVVLGGHGTARAYDVLIVDADGTVSCAPLPDCPCPTGLTCMPGPDAMLPPACFPDGGPTAVVYCCTDRACPAASPSDPGVCIDVTGRTGSSFGICAYRGSRDFCIGVDGELSSDSFDKCIEEVPPRLPRIVDYGLGNCDGNADGPNGSDPCPCDPANTCTLGRDAGIGPDAGSDPVVDAGPPQDDAGARDSGVRPIDGGTRPPPASAEGVRFHGSGGCECTAAAGRPAGPIPPAALVFAAIALALYSSCGMRSRGLRK